jgi:polysaccharide chain length determinant protein (PEP-CTERM system associated)
MLPGKMYAPEDVLLIFQRRFWLLIVPFAIVAATTAVVARSLPDLYRSEALILVEPQRVPEAYVKSTVTTRIEDRLQAIANQILSRTRLERIIQEFNLFEKERANGGAMEDLLDDMRANIGVKVERGDAFRVSYIGREPTTVQKVTERLATLFINESLRDREVLAQGTSQFLESNVDEARRRLVEKEKTLEDYKRQFSGQLPTQVESNLAAIQVNTQHIQSILEAQRRLREDRMTLERRLEDEQAGMDSGPASAGGPIIVVSSTTQQLEAARAELAAWRQKYTPEFPEVKKAQRRVSELEAQAEAEALNMPVAAAAQAANPAQAARLRRVKEMQDKITEIDKDIATNAEQEKALRAKVNSYQARVDAVPTRESELIELTRDYGILQAQYGSLLAKKEDSNIAANLEHLSFGEQFKLLDSARRPERPFSPNRQAINLGGVFGGLAVGIALIALLEYRDATFKTDDDITRVLALPVLAVVPVMQSTLEKRLAFRRGLLFSLSMCALVSVCLGVVVLFTFFSNLLPNVLK